MDTIGRLQAYMKRHNLKQWQMAHVLKVPERTLQRWLSGKVKMSQAYQRALETIVYE